MKMLIEIIMGIVEMMTIVPFIKIPRLYKKDNTFKRQCLLTILIAIIGTVSLFFAFYLSKSSYFGVLLIIGAFLPPLALMKFSDLAVRADQEPLSPNKRKPKIINKKTTNKKPSNIGSFFWKDCLV